MKKLTDLTIKRGWGEPIELPIPSALGVLAGGGKVRVHIFGLGDVGRNLLVGLRLMGGTTISKIGIYDINQAQVDRMVMETGQIYCNEDLPSVEGVSAENLFDCDIFIFAASAGIPQVKEGVDVRMAQLEANSGIISGLAEKYSDALEDYKGMVFVLSDPVDPLCMEFLNLTSLNPWQIRGFGLGVMYARGRFYAERDEKLSSFLEEGRAFGPHGKDLVLANSLENYDQEVSESVTDLAIKSNMEVRALGFKPFIAPAFSSGALSMVSFLKGGWSYGSLYMGNEDNGTFLGVKSRIKDGKVIWEDMDIPDQLFQRIDGAYENLLELERGRRG